MPVTKYIYNPLTEAYLMETDGDGNVTARYTQEPVKYGDIHAQHRIDPATGVGKSYYYHPDALGSTRELTDSNGDVVATYNYDAFGNTIASTGTVENPFRFTGNVGYYWDEELQTYHIRARNYQPTIGRWMSQDPIGFEGGVNLYAAYFVPFGIDPLGLDSTLGNGVIVGNQDEKRNCHGHTCGVVGGDSKMDGDVQFPGVVGDGTNPGDVNKITSDPCWVWATGLLGNPKSMSSADIYPHKSMAVLCAINRSLMARGCTQKGTENGPQLTFRFGSGPGPATCTGNPSKCDVVILLKWHRGKPSWFEPIHSTTYNGTGWESNDDGRVIVAPRPDLGRGADGKGGSWSDYHLLLCYSCKNDCKCQTGGK